MKCKLHVKGKVFILRLQKDFFLIKIKQFIAINTRVSILIYKKAKI
jgi:hypothetical protein